MKTAFFVLLAAAVISTTAQAAPTESEQRLACMGDAFRLCSQYIPDRDQVRRCLAVQHDALSSGCRPVFDASMKAYQQRYGHP